MSNTPAKKTRAELLRDINEIREQVRKDAPIWESRARQQLKQMDRGETFLIGLIVGVALMALIGFVAGAGSHTHPAIRSSPTQEDK